MEDLPRTNEAEIESKLRTAKRYLAETDYVIIKMQEYAMLNKEIDNDYTEILTKREEARETIRNLENKT